MDFFSTPQTVYREAGPFRWTSKIKKTLPQLGPRGSYPLKRRHAGGYSCLTRPRWLSAWLRGALEHVYLGTVDGSEIRRITWGWR